MKPDITACIRKYRPEDKAAVRDICCQTALVGAPSAIFFDDDEVFADALTLYFTDHEPESCFVVEDGNVVVGYLLAAQDKKCSEKIISKKIIFPLLIKALRRGTLLRRKNLRFLFHVCASALKGELNVPSFMADYPATLHVNLIKTYRAQGLGTKLIDVCLAYLKEQGIRGIHFATLSEQASQFYKKQGFQLLFKGHRSYFRYFLGKDLPIYIYGMLLK